MINGQTVKREGRPGGSFKPVATDLPSDLGESLRALIPDVEVRGCGSSSAAATAGACSCSLGCPKHELLKNLKKEYLM